MTAQKRQSRYAEPCQKRYRRGEIIEQMDELGQQDFSLALG